VSRTKIQAAERPIGDIFSDEFRFTMPMYQRPYSWTTEQAGEMFDDLLAAATAHESLDDVDPYFLGSVVVVKGEERPPAEVVDGQQRLTTLTVLLSVIRGFVSPEFADSLEARIFQKGDPIRGTKNEPRLTLRDRDQAFLQKYVQESNGVATLEARSIDLLPDSQQNLALNARCFAERLAGIPREGCERLVTFIDLHTYLVVVATQDFESAYRIFTVLNERGLDLTHSDILKSEIIGAIPEADQAAYNAKWEQEEEDLGRSDFADLFSHIRMVFAKSKARGSILREFRLSVLSTTPDRRAFVDDVLVPLSNAFEVVTRADYRAARGADEVNRLLGWLNQLDNADWVPPAISYLRDVDRASTDVARFLADLERLSASILIRRHDVTRRVERYGRVLDAIERGRDPFAEGSPLQLDADERAETRARLDDEIYTVTRVRLYVLLRLDSALSSGGATYDHPLITVEHVLPQNPKDQSAWRTDFADEDRRYWVHRLANLLLLTRRKNSEAGNLEFDPKKASYFSTKGVSPFALTTQVLTAPTWTPDVLAARQQELLGALARLWRL
jgi:hypothetical protein